LDTVTPGVVRPANIPEGPGVQCDVTFLDLTMPGGSEATDDELIAAIRAGSATAEAQLYRRHAPRVHRLAWRLARDADLARDLAQDVFVRLFESLASFRGESAFTTWLHRVTVTTCLNGLRRRRFRRREVPLTAAHGVAADHPDRLLLTTLDAAIAALPESLRLPLVLHALEGWSHREIATALRITEASSRRRVHEARVALRGALDLTPGEHPR